MECSSAFDPEVKQTSDGGPRGFVYIRDPEAGGSPRGFVYIGDPEVFPPQVPTTD